MKFLPLIWAGLWRKPARTALTLLAITAAFALFGLLGFVDDGFKEIVRTSHYDRLIVNPMFGTPMPQATVNEIQRIPGVQKIAALSAIFGAFRETRMNLGVGFTDDTIFAMRDELKITTAQRAEWAKTPNGVIITRAIAKRYGLNAGETFSVTSPTPRKDGSRVWTFQVIAVIDNRDKGDNDSLTVGNYSYFDEDRTTDQGTYSFLLISIADPDKSVPISQEIDKLFQNSGTPTRTMSERAAFEAGSQSLGDIHSFALAVTGGVMFMLLFLTANTLMQTVRERRVELATMSSLGFDQPIVFALVAAEAVLLCLVGAAVGLALAVGLSPLISATGLPHTSGIPWGTLVQGLTIAIVVGLLSCAMPVLRLRRMSVIDVLSRR